MPGRTGNTAPVPLAGPGPGALTAPSPCRPGLRRLVLETGIFGAKLKGGKEEADDKPRLVWGPGFEFCAS